jgi:hypothetical protein
VVVRELRLARTLATTKRVQGKWSRDAGNALIPVQETVSRWQRRPEIEGPTWASLSQSRGDRVQKVEDD